MGVAGTSPRPPTHPRQFDSPVQGALAAPGFHDHVVPAGWQDTSDALICFVLVRVARLYGDVHRPHLLDRSRGENTDSAPSDDSDAGLRADLTLVAAVQ